MFYGFKDGKCYRLRKRITSAICTMCILFNLFPMSVFSAYAAEGGVNATTTENSISADGKIKIKDGFNLKEIKNNVTAGASYADEGKYDEDFYKEIKTNYTSGYTKQYEALKISTPAELAAFAKFVNDGNDFAGKFVRLTENITLNSNFDEISYEQPVENTKEKAVTFTISGKVENSWNPIGNDSTSFNGTFMGDEHNITNMFVKGGLFGVIGTSGVVKSVNVKSAMVYGECAGGIAGTNKGEIRNCKNSGIVSASTSASSSYSYVGGIAGKNEGTIKDCKNSAAVSSSSAFKFANIGGIAGENTGTIENCNNEGAISSSASSSDSYSSPSAYAGGIAGESTGTIKNCKNSGAISAFASPVSGSEGTTYSYSGGIVGNNTTTIKDKGIIEGCNNSGTVYSYATSSGSGKEAEAGSGGIVGRNYDGTIENCGNSGAVSSSVPNSSKPYSRAGGIVSNNNGTVKNCNNSGTVFAAASNVANAHAGGIIGTSFSGTVKNCLSISRKVEACFISPVSLKYSNFSTQAGGIVGNLDTGDIKQCYYDNTVVNKDKSEGNTTECVKGAIGNGKDKKDDVEGKSKEDLTTSTKLFDADNNMWLYESGQYPTLYSASLAITPSITVANNGNASCSFEITSGYEQYTDYDSKTIQYQWYKDGERIGSASNSSYTLQKGEENNKISCRVGPKNRVGVDDAKNYAEIEADITKKVALISIKDIPEQPINVTGKTIKSYVTVTEGAPATYEYKLNTAEEYIKLEDNSTFLAGDYTLRVKIEDSNYYAEESTKSFKVKDTDAIEIEAVHIYDGQPWKPWVKVNGEKITDPSYYNIEYTHIPNSEDDTTDTKDMTNVGKKDIKVTLKGKYTGSAQITGEIKYLAAPEKAYTISGVDYEEKDKEGKATGTLWIKSGNKVTVTPAKGYKIKTKSDAEYEDTLTISVDTDPLEIYLENAYGQKTDVIKTGKKIKVDITKPTGSIEIGDKSENIWKKLIKAISFGSINFGETQEVTIKASDEESGVASTEYYVANKDLLGDNDATEEELDAAVKKISARGEWYKYNAEAKYKLTKTQKYVVYAKITDNVGNVTYMSSDGIKVYSEPEVVTNISNFQSGDTVTYVIPKGEKGIDDKIIHLHLNKFSLSGITLKKGKEEEPLKSGDAYNCGPNEKYKTYEINIPQQFFIKHFTESMAGDYKFIIKFHNEDVNEDVNMELNLVARNKTIPGLDQFDFTAPTNLEYDGSIKTATVKEKSGVTGIGKITVKYYKVAKDGTVGTEEVIPKDAGKYKVKIDVADGEDYAYRNGITGENWEFTITKADLTKDQFKLEPSTAYYNGKDQQVKVVPVEGVTDVGNIAPLKYYKVNADNTVGTEEVIPKDVGKYEVRVEVEETANRNKGSLTFTFEIKQATLKADDFDVTPNKDSKIVYNGKDQQVTATVKAGVNYNGDKTVKCYKVAKDGTVGTEDVVPKDAGKYTVKIRIDGDDNYKPVEVADETNWTFEITSKDVKDNDKIKVTLEGRIYDGKEPTITVKDEDLSSELQNLVKDTDYKVTWTKGGEDKAGEGSKEIKVEFQGNYKGTKTASCKIDYLTAPKDSYNIKGDYEATDGTIWVKSGGKVTVTSAEGYKYTIATDLKGTFGETLNISASTNPLSIYLKNAKGQMTAAVKTVKVDSKCPDVKVSINDANKSFWEKLLSKLTFGLSFTEDKEVTITAGDNESGKKSVEYFLANEDLIDTENAKDEDAVKKLEKEVNNRWTKYEDKPIALKKSNKYVVYTKVTDNVGNITYVSSNGIVVYSEATLDVESIQFTKTSSDKKTINLDLHGIHSIVNIKLVNGNNESVIANDNYTLSGPDENGKTTITFTSKYLDSLSAGDYKLKIDLKNTLNGEENSKSVDLKIEKATLVASDFKVTVPTGEDGKDLEYDGNAKVATVTTDKPGIDVAKDITVNYYKDGATTPVNEAKDAGKYEVKIAVKENANYNTTTEDLSNGWKFKIEKATLGASDFNVKVPTNQDGKDLEYDGNAKVATVTTDKPGIDVAKDITVNYYKDGATTPVNEAKDAGEYEVKIAVKGNANYNTPTEDLSNGWKFKIEKATLKASDFEVSNNSVVYNGDTQKPDITTTKGGVGDITSIKYIDEKGEEVDPINAGTYKIKVVVAEGDNYKATTADLETNLTFTIEQAEVEDIETPDAKSDIKYGTKLSEVALEDGWYWANDKIIPSFGIADYEVYFDMEYDPNYDYSAVEGYNKDNNRVERLISVTTVVDKSNWGKPAESEYDNVENYVSDNGAVSAEVKENGIVWINSESADRPVWYAIDNSNGIFEKGSRFEIRRLDKELSQNDWKKYKGLFDDKHLKELNEDKLEIFLVTVISPDGNEYAELNSDLSLYVKLGDDWDKDDLAAVFLGEGNNEDIGLEYIDSMSCPGGTDRFAKLTLKHLSPYAIYEKAANNNPSDDKPNNDNNGNINNSGKPNTDSNENNIQNNQQNNNTSNNANQNSQQSTNISNNTNSDVQSNTDNSNVNSIEKQTNDAKKDESVWDYVATGDQTSYSFILRTTIIAIISYSAIVLLRRKRKEK